MRYIAGRSEGGTGENRSYVTHLNFRVGTIFYATFSNIWEKKFKLLFFPKKKLVTPLDKIRSALTEQVYIYLLTYYLIK